MATDTFEWPVRISGSEQITVSALMAQFGDGYRQVAENGINSASETWNLSVNGQRDEMAAVRTFLKNHVIRSFWWINPWGEKKLYRVKTDSINPKFINKGFVEITFTFEQAFAP